MKDIKNSHAKRKASKKLQEWKFLVSRNVNLNYVMLITTRRHLTSLRALSSAIRYTRAALGFDETLKLLDS